MTEKHVADTASELTTANLVSRVHQAYPIEESHKFLLLSPLSPFAPKERFPPPQNGTFESGGPNAGGCPFPHKRYRMHSTVAVTYTTKVHVTIQHAVSLFWT
jgi:hypothetical protein